MRTAEKFLAEKGARVEAALEAALDAHLAGAPDRLAEAVRYAVFGPGKRLRPVLALGACEIVSGSDDAAMPAACALELIHTYSLVHDDLPCMDDDDLRRGRATIHKQFDEATAVLAGDALQSLAFALVAENEAVARELAQAAGPLGMVGGQQLDLEAEESSVDLAGLERIHRMKTGALIRGACRIGAIAGGADEDALAALTQYGEHLGLAFQIVDDILDVTGDPEATGKASGSDASRNKSTFVSLLGPDQARSRATAETESAREALSRLGDVADSFRELVSFVLNRDH